MCGNNIPLKKGRKKKKKKSTAVAQHQKTRSFSREDTGGFFSPPLVELEPDLAVCKHLALSQKRLILRILHTGRD